MYNNNNNNKTWQNYDEWKIMSKQMSTETRMVNEQFIHDCKCSEVRRNNQQCALKMK